MSENNNPEPNWDTSSHEDFYKYYEQQSLSEATKERFRAVRDMMLRVGGAATAGRVLDVLDVGCGAGAQSEFWAELGHRYRGVDVNEPLIQLARKRASERGFDIRFDVGSATELPCADASIDVCLVPELLEHVADWQGCLNEAVRVLRPGGLMYISTSSVLCPVQQEFNLPLYSWYPGPLKRYFEKRAVGDWPAVANFAKYPAVHWFSFYGLRDYLAPKGFACLDRFDLTDLDRLSGAKRAAVGIMRSLPPFRFLGHVLTPYTVIVARKR